MLPNLKGLIHKPWGLLQIQDSQFSPRFRRKNLPSNPSEAMAHFRMAAYSALYGLLEEDQKRISVAYQLNKLVYFAGGQIIGVRAYQELREVDSYLSKVIKAAHIDFKSSAPHFSGYVFGDKAKRLFRLGHAESEKGMCKRNQKDFARLFVEYKKRQSCLWEAAERGQYGVPYDPKAKARFLKLGPEVVTALFSFGMSKLKDSFARAVYCEGTVIEASLALMTYVAGMPGDDLKRLSAVYKWTPEEFFKIAADERSVLTTGGLKKIDQLSQFGKKACQYIDDYPVPIL